jgi:hypothetical protein
MTAAPCLPLDAATTPADGTSRNKRLAKAPPALIGLSLVSDGWIRIKLSQAHEVRGQVPVQLARALTGEAHIANPDRGNDFHLNVQEPAQLFASLCKEASRNGITFSITASAACSGNR